MSLSPSPQTIQHALLGILQRQPMHGYELHQHLSDPAGLGLVWHVKQSYVYSMLTKLEQLNYIEASVEEQASRPPRKIFRPTEQGAAAHQAWILTPIDHGRDFRLEFLTKLYSTQSKDTSLARHLLSVQRTACRAWLSEQETETLDLPEDQVYDWLVRQFRIGQIQAMLAWLDVCEERLIGA